MVKLPSLDELKKKGNDLVKNTKSGALLQKIKTHVDNLGGADPDADGSTGDPAADAMNRIKKVIGDIQKTQRIQASLIGGLKDAVVALAHATGQDASAIEEGEEGAAAETKADEKGKDAP